MPSMGIPVSKTARGREGLPSRQTESGPPDKIIPEGFSLSIFSSADQYGTISQYTESSRTRRPISCVYWEPKSRIRIFSRLIGVLRNKIG